MNALHAFVLSPDAQAVGILLVNVLCTVIMKKQRGNSRRFTSFEARLTRIEAAIKHQQPV